MLVTLARVPARALVEGGAPVECSTCGVRAIMAAPASSCAFCGSSRLRQGSGRERLVAPAVELSFAVEREAAAEAIRRFVLGRWLAPADVDPAELPAPTAVLLPSWVYHVQSTVQYRGRRGDDAWSSGGSATDRPLLGRPIRLPFGLTLARPRPRRRIRWRAVEGVVRPSLAPARLGASQLVPAWLVDALPSVGTAAQPRDRAIARPDGAVIERYAIEPAEALRVLEGHAERELRTAVRRDIGGDRQRIHDLRLHADDGRFELWLRPVWLTAYRHRNRTRRVLVDGRTGAVVGERPPSVVRVAVVMLAAAVLAVVVLAGGVGLLGQ